MVSSSNDFRFSCSGIQLVGKSFNLRFNGFEIQKMKLGSSKTKLFSETSFKNEASKLKSEAFLKMKLWSSKAKLFWNKGFLRDFLQKWHVDPTFGFRITIRFGDFKADASKVLHLPPKKSAQAKWSLLGNISVTWNLQTNVPQIQRPMPQTLTSDSTKSLRKKHRFGPSSNPPRLPTFLQPSRTPAPAMYFATCLNPAPATLPPKTTRAPGALTILATKSLSLHSVAQI